MTTGFGRRFAAMVAAIAVATTGLALPARAGLTITLTDVNTGTTETINGDGTFSGNGPSSTIITTGNQIVYAPLGGFGNFANVTLTVTTNSPGNLVRGQLQDIQLDTRNTSATADTITVTVSSDGFTLPGSPGSHVQLKSDLASSGNDGTGTFTSSIDGTPTPLLTLTGNGDVFNSIGEIRGTTYTMTNTMTETLSGGQTGQLTGTSTVTAAPEPTTLAAALIGLGLPLAGTVRRMRRRRVQA